MDSRDAAGCPWILHTSVACCYSVALPSRRSLYTRIHLGTALAGSRGSMVSVLDNGVIYTPVWMDLSIDDWVFVLFWPTRWSLRDAYAV